MVVCNEAVQILVSARRVADFAGALGTPPDMRRVRSCCPHLGAVLADSILQAGLNYATVVRPRVMRILSSFPEASTTDKLVKIVQSGGTRNFLDWEHHLKVSRFDRLVGFIDSNKISDVADLRDCLKSRDFCSLIQELNGIGPKTVDYMACLVGIESIAVDRHIRSFARQVGVEDTDYNHLKNVFCVAADLLSVSRREFDAWVWRHESERKTSQMSFGF
jgi:hypothetical protein